MLALIFTASGVFHLRVVSAEPETWTVDDDGSADFSRIQDAVDAASHGDTIFVYDGIYNENLVVAKSISLLGASKETTIVDGRSVGTVVQIRASNVNIANFTIKSAGKTWGPPPGSGTPDSCILGEDVFNVRITDNILMDAAVCVWIAYSSSVDIEDNAVLSGVYGGIIGYSSVQLSISRNFVDNCGLMGIHLDGASIHCAIVGNVVMNNLEGLELESGSAANRIEDNVFTNNNASIVLNRCGSLNVFRRNSMTISVYHLVVVPYSLESFLQDIDSSNLVEDKPIYYLVNLRDQGISPVNCPNAGYLAIVNCSDVAVKGFNLFGNGDGVLVAYSTGCIFTNITAGGNLGSLLWGGFTFYNSNDNIVTKCRVAASSCALAFYRSESNVFYHNSFMNNEKQVMSDFLTPFSNESSGYISANIWDYDFEGNFWSNYMGVDGNKDGVGDTPYVIDSKNVDLYPLIEALPKSDMKSPDIFVISFVTEQQDGSSYAKVLWEGSDDVSGISHYEIRLDYGLWVNVGLNTSYTFTGLSDGAHTIEIKATDKAGNVGQKSFGFSVSAGGFQLPPYLREVVIVVVIVVAAVVALYVVRTKGVVRRRVTSRRLVR